MNKNLKKIIALAMVLGTISAVAPAKNVNLLITKAYASDSEADELTSIELQTSDGDSIDLYTDSSYDDELDDDDLTVGDTYYAKTSENKIVIDSIDGADEDKVRIFKGSTEYEVGEDISISSDTKTTLKVRVYEDEYDSDEDYTSSDYNQYTIVVENTDENADDADLLGIALSNGNINFNPDTTSYEVSVPTDAESIIVQATPKDSDDTVKINGTTVDSDDEYKETVSLSSTSNTITIKVSNDDDSKTYTLTVNKTLTAGAIGLGANAGAMGQGMMGQGANAGAIGQGAGTANQTQGWKQVGGLWYYLDSTGKNKTGWIQDNGKWYYCNSDGSMASNTTIGGYQVGADGAWIK